MKVAFIDTVHPALENQLTQKGVQCDGLYRAGREELKTLIVDYDGIVIRSRTRMDQDFLSHAKKLRFIARSGAGMENIDLEYCKRRNIVCFNSPEGNRDAVGEHAIGMILMLMNQLKRCDAEVREGLWKREENRGHEIAGKTVAIIGYGNMGSALAKKLTGFDCRIIAYDKYKKGFGTTNVQEVDLNTIFNEADIVSLHVPLSEETHYLVNENFIHSMKKPFYLINTARGQNVQLKAVQQGLESGKIIGACLDVLEFEKSSFENLSLEHIPSEMQYLIHSDKVILSPHVAGWTHESYVKLSTYLAEKIISHFNL